MVFPVPTRLRNMTMIRNSGFTLIELLVVVAIISVLSTMLMANYVGVRQRARDVQRKSELRQIQSALEVYRSDYGLYPLTSQASFICNSQFLSPDGTTTYMRKVPCDPLVVPGSPSTGIYNSGNYYYASPDGLTYTLGSCLENGNDSDQNDTSTNPGGTAPCTSGKYFVLYNP